MPSAVTLGGGRWARIGLRDKAKSMMRRWSRKEEGMCDLFFFWPECLLMPLTEKGWEEEWSGKGREISILNTFHLI